MRPIRTIATALLVASLAMAGCQRPTDQTTTAVPTPTQVQRVAPTTTAPARQAAPPSRPPASAAPKPVPAPAPETIVGLWPVRTLAQARRLQNSVDAGHQPWLLSPKLVSIAYAATELDLFEPVARQIGPAAYKVGPRNSEWVATLYLAQPVRQGVGGVWVVTRTGNPGSYA